MNSEAAKQLKDVWTPLVNYEMAVNTILGDLSDAKFSFLEMDKIQNKFEDAREGFARVRDKICETQGARSLARPRPVETTRKVLVAGAKSIIESLHRVVPPPLALLMEQQMKAPADAPLARAATIVARTDSALRMHACAIARRGCYELDTHMERKMLPNGVGMNQNTFQT